MKNNTGLNFYIDTLIVNAIIKDNGFNKKAESGIVMALIDKTKSYVENHIDPNDKAGSLFNILGPGAIFTAFIDPNDRAFGFGWIGTLLGLAVNIFHIDISSMISSIWDKLKGMISGDKPVSSSQVDSLVHEVAQSHMKPATQEEADEAEKILNKKSFDELIKDVRLVKFAALEYSNNKDIFNTKKNTTISIFARVISWILKIGLASAGLMVAGDIVNKFLNRPNGLDGSIQNGHVSTKEDTNRSPAMPVTNQTIFKLNPSYRVENNNNTSTWIENYSNNSGSVKNMLIDFAKDVYIGLDGKESIIESTPGFQAIADRIIFFNRASSGSPMIFIPHEFVSKKQIVDYFIDDVAEKSM